MQIGEEVTWKEFVRPVRNQTRVRFTTGVIVGERVRRDARQLEIAVRFISGSLPKTPYFLVWIAESTIAFGRTSAAHHVRKNTPLKVFKRSYQQRVLIALADAEEEVRQLRQRLARHEAAV